MYGDLALGRFALLVGTVSRTSGRVAFSVGSRYSYIMMKNDLMFSQKALEASFVLHKQLLTDSCYDGYDGGKDAFDNLYNEVLVICRDELPDDADIDYVVETFHDYQLEQANGYREIGWYL